MSLIDPQIPKEYQNGNVLFEQNLDAWRESVEDYFAIINLNLTQLRKDAFLANYDFDNDGNANLPKNLQQQINDLTSGSTPIGGTTSDTWTINSDGNSAILSSAGLTAVRTYTFPDVSGVLVTAAGSQTLSNKTFSDNLVWLSGLAFSGTLDHSNTANRVYTFPDVSGEVMISSGGAGTAIFTTNVDVYNGFDFRAYSDAGVTQTAGIDGASGSAFFGGSSVGTNNNLTLRNLDNTSVNSHAVADVVVGGASGGDPMYLWTITGVGSYYAGIDNSDSDKWIFGGGTVVGTTPKLVFDNINDRWGVFTASPGADFDITKNDPGQLVTCRVVNSDNTNALSRSAFAAIVAGPAGGDPFNVWSVSGGDAYYMGIDNSDSDILKIGLGGTVGTNVGFTLTGMASNTRFNVLSPLGFSAGVNLFPNGNAAAFSIRTEASATPYLEFLPTSAAQYVRIDDGGNIVGLDDGAERITYNASGYVVNSRTVSSAGARVLIPIAVGYLIQNIFNIDSSTRLGAGEYKFDYSVAIDNSLFPQAIPQASIAGTIMSVICTDFDLTYSTIAVLDDAGIGIDSLCQMNVIGA